MQQKPSYALVTDRSPFDTVRKPSPSPVLATSSSVPSLSNGAFAGPPSAHTFDATLTATNGVMRTVTIRSPTGSPQPVTHWTSIPKDTPAGVAHTYLGARSVASDHAASAPDPAPASSSNTQQARATGLTLQNAAQAVQLSYAVNLHGDPLVPLAYPVTSWAPQQPPQVQSLASWHAQQAPLAHHSSVLPSQHVPAAHTTAAHPAPHALAKHPTAPPPPQQSSQTDDLPIQQALALPTHPGGASPGQQGLPIQPNRVGAAETSSQVAAADGATPAHLQAGLPFPVQHPSSTGQHSAAPAPLGTTSDAAMPLGTNASDSDGHHSDVHRPAAISPGRRHVQPGSLAAYLLSMAPPAAAVNLPIQGGITQDTPAAAEGLLPDSLAAQGAPGAVGHTEASNSSTLLGAMAAQSDAAGAHHSAVQPGVDATRTTATAAASPSPAAPSQSVAHDVAHDALPAPQSSHGSSGMPHPAANGPVPHAGHTDASSTVQPATDRRGHGSELALALDVATDTQAPYAQASPAPAVMTQPTAAGQPPSVHTSISPLLTAERPYDTFLEAAAAGTAATEQRQNERAATAVVEQDPAMYSTSGPDDTHMQLEHGVVRHASTPGAAAGQQPEQRPLVVVATPDGQQEYLLSSSTATASTAGSQQRAAAVEVSVSGRLSTAQHEHLATISTTSSSSIPTSMPPPATNTSASQPQDYQSTPDDTGDSMTMGMQHQLLSPPAADRAPSTQHEYQATADAAAQHEHHATTSDAQHAHQATADAAAQHEYWSATGTATAELSSTQHGLPLPATGAIHSTTQSQQHQPFSAGAMQHAQHAADVSTRDSPRHDVPPGPRPTDITVQGQGHPATGLAVPAPANAEQLLATPGTTSPPHYPPPAPTTHHDSTNAPPGPPLLVNKEQASASPAALAPLLAQQQLGEHPVAPAHGATPAGMDIPAAMPPHQTAATRPQQAAVLSAHIAAAMPTHQAAASSHEPPSSATGSEAAGQMPSPPSLHDATGAAAADDPRRPPPPVHDTMGAAAADDESPTPPPFLHDALGAAAAADELRSPPPLAHATSPAANGTAAEQLRLHADSSGAGQSFIISSSPAEQPAAPASASDERVHAAEAISASRTDGETAAQQQQQEQLVPSSSDSGQKATNIAGTSHAGSDAAAQQQQQQQQQQQHAPPSPEKATNIVEASHASSDAAGQQQQHPAPPSPEKAATDIVEASHAGSDAAGQQRPDPSADSGQQTMDSAGASQAHAMCQRQLQEAKAQLEAEQQLAQDLRSQLEDSQQVQADLQAQLDAIREAYTGLWDELESSKAQLQAARVSSEELSRYQMRMQKAERALEAERAQVARLHRSISDSGPAKLEQRQLSEQLLQVQQELTSALARLASQEAEAKKAAERADESAGTVAMLREQLAAALAAVSTPPRPPAQAGDAAEVAALREQLAEALAAASAQPPLPPPAQDRDAAELAELRKQLVAALAASSAQLPPPAQSGDAAELGALTSESQRLRDELATAVAEMKRLGGELAAVIAENDRLGSELASAIEENQRLRLDQARHAEVAVLAAENERLRAEVAAAVAESDRLREVAGRDGAEHDGWELRARAAEERAHAAEQVAMDTHRQCQSAASTIDKLLEENANLAEKVNKQSTAMAALEAQLQAQEQQLHTLRTQGDPSFSAWGRPRGSAPGAGGPGSPRAVAKTPVSVQIMRLTEEVHELEFSLEQERHRRALVGSQLEAMVGGVLAASMALDGVTSPVNGPSLTSQRSGGQLHMPGAVGGASPADWLSLAAGGRPADLPLDVGRMSEEELQLLMLREEAKRLAAELAREQATREAMEARLEDEQRAKGYPDVYGAGSPIFQLSPQDTSNSELAYPALTQSTDAHTLQQPHPPLPAIRTSLSDTGPYTPSHPAPASTTQASTHGPLAGPYGHPQGQADSRPPLVTPVAAPGADAAHSGLTSGAAAPWFANRQDALMGHVAEHVTTSIHATGAHAAPHQSTPGDYPHHAHGSPRTPPHPSQLPGAPARVPAGRGPGSLQLQGSHQADVDDEGQEVVPLGGYPPRSPASVSPGPRRRGFLSWLWGGSDDEDA